MYSTSCSQYRTSQTKRNRIFFSLLTAVMAAGGQPVVAGPNDFFGSAMPAGQLADPNANQFATPGQTKAGDMLNQSNPGDYTDDEKRMQKKFKASISHARGLIA
ncbi:MAG TPA: hypothetical protein EYM95_08995, partial [Candidatus Obscuribacterales bacterium]|nr:hypothetical protein [Candidatus Obscuribacterales bacterium]